MLADGTSHRLDLSKVTRRNCANANNEEGSESLNPDLHAVDYRWLSNGTTSASS